MQCPQCSAEVVGDAVYCHKCGARLNSPGDDFEPSTTSNPADSDYGAQADEISPVERFSRDRAERRDRDDDEEQELWSGRYSSKAMLGNWIFSVLITIILIVGAFWWGNQTGWLVVVAAILLLWLYQTLMLAWRVVSVRYRLTSQRFFHEAGVLRRVTDRIEVIDIDDVTYEQSIVERLAGVGTIRISSSDRSHPELVIPGIEDVAEVAGMIDKARHKERRARGLHIESV